MSFVFLSVCLVGCVCLLDLCFLFFLDCLCVWVFGRMCFFFVLDVCLRVCLRTCVWMCAVVCVCLFAVDCKVSARLWLGVCVCVFVCDCVFWFVCFCLLAQVFHLACLFVRGCFGSGELCSGYSLSAVMVGMDTIKQYFWKYLAVWVCFGVVIGCLLGWMFKESGATDETFKNIIKTPGDLYTRGLNCILVPFIFCSMITSVFNLRTLVNGNKIGKATVAFYVFTTLCAAILAASVSAMLIVPNVDTFDDSAVPDSAVSQGDAKISAYSDFQDDCGYDSEVWCKIWGNVGEHCSQQHCFSNGRLTAPWSDDIRGDGRLIDS